jgi:hypothetical protein
MIVIMTFDCANDEQFAAAKAALFEWTVFGKCIGIEADPETVRHPQRIEYSSLAAAERTKT